MSMSAASARPKINRPPAFLTQEPIQTQLNLAVASQARHWWMSVGPRWDFSFMLVTGMLVLALTFAVGFGLQHQKRYQENQTILVNTSVIPPLTGGDLNNPSQTATISDGYIRTPRNPVLSLDKPIIAQRSEGMPPARTTHRNIDKEGARELLSILNKD